MSRAAPSSPPPPPPTPPPQVWNVPTDPIGPGPLGRRGPSLFHFTFDFIIFFPLPILFSPLRRPISHAHVHVHVHLRTSARTLVGANRFCARRRGSRFFRRRRGSSSGTQSYAVAARVYPSAVVFPAYPNPDSSHVTKLSRRTGTG